MTRDRANVVGKPFQNQSSTRVAVAHAVDARPSAGRRQDERRG